MTSPTTAPASRFETLDLSAYALPADLVTRLPTPALVVYLDHVRENIRRVLEHLGGDASRWRPHAKTPKLPPVYRALVDAGVRAFKCATTREAACLLDVLREAGTPGDVLLAHPLVGPGLARLDTLAREHPESRLSVLCEDPAAVDGIPGELGVFIDVNPGMDRTGVPLGRGDGVRVIRVIARRAGARLRGVHFYEGHLQGMDAATRRRAAFACYDRLMTLLGKLAADGVSIAEVITSGTPTFPCALAYPGFAGGVVGGVGGADGPGHRVSPGTVVLHDHRSEQEIEELDLVPAAVVVTRVVSHPAADTITCDAGSKSVAADAGDPCAYVLGHPELVALTPSEEHLPLRATGGAAPTRGTVLLLVPRHVCPTVNLADEAVLMDGGRFAGVAAVAARGHDGITGG